MARRSKVIALAFASIGVALGIVAVSCGTDDSPTGGQGGLGIGGTTGNAGPPMSRSSSAQAVVDQIRKTFVVAMPNLAMPNPTEIGLPSIRKAVLEDSPVEAASDDGNTVALSFKALSSDTLGVKRTAHVALPHDYGRGFRLTHENGNTHIDVTAKDAVAGVAAQYASGYLVYKGGVKGGIDVVHRPSPTGTEDFYLLPSSTISSFDYTVTIGPGIAGLRLAQNSLEFVDDKGSPKLHSSPPLIVDKAGRTLEATVSVPDCAVDTTTLMPWGHAATPPGRSTCTIHIAWDASKVSYPALLDPSWSTSSLMATARLWHASTNYLGRVWVLGGMGITGSYLSSVEIFDPTTNSWATLSAAMTRARAAAAAVTFPNGTGTPNLIVTGGIGSSDAMTTADTFVVQRTAFFRPFTMPNPHAGHTATWLPITGSHLHTPPSQPMILIFGGFDSNSRASEVTNCLMTDGSWSNCSTFFSGGAWYDCQGIYKRYYHTATLAANNTRLVIAGGYGRRWDDSSGPDAALDNIEVYDVSQTPNSRPPNLGTFQCPSPKSTSIGSRYLHTASTFGSQGNRVLFAGGANGVDRIASASIYDASTDSFSAASSMTTARYIHVAATLTNGSILVGGGSDLANAMSSVEVYNPSTNTWSAGSPMQASRIFATANNLDDGRILIAGGDGISPGENASSSALRNAQTYALLTWPSACTTNGDCQSGLCAGGVCCNTACTGNCQACSIETGAATNGQCLTVAGGFLGQAACSNNTLCDGVSPNCPASCASDAGCISDTYCASSTCHSKGNVGATCTSPNQCITRTCTSGACACATGFTWCATAGKCIDSDGCCVSTDCTLAKAPDPCHTATPSCNQQRCVFNSIACPSGNVCKIAGATASCGAAPLSLSVTPTASSYPLAPNIFADGTVGFNVTISNISGSPVTVALDDRRLFSATDVQKGGVSQVGASYGVEYLISPSVTYVTLNSGTAVSRLVSGVVGNPSANGYGLFQYQAQSGNYSVSIEYQSPTANASYPNLFTGVLKASPATFGVF